MIEVYVGVSVMEKVLNQGLRILMTAVVAEGMQFRIIEATEEGKTGRVFYARALHDMGLGVIQIELLPFMEAISEETGELERIPMAGEFSNEKYSVPSEGWKTWECEVKGEKPIWIYWGVKWIQEICLAKLFFGTLTPLELEMKKIPPPHTLHLKFQSQGGEKTFRYSCIGESE